VIYFAQAECGGPIKIGYADAVGERVADLQIAMPQRLVVLGVMDGTRSTENEMHRRLHHIRVRGEWFQDCHELRRLIAEYARPFDLPEPRLATRKWPDEMERTFHAALIAGYPESGRARAIARDAGVTIKQATNWLSRKSMPQLPACIALGAANATVRRWWLGHLDEASTGDNERDPAQVLNDIARLLQQRGP
jgi:hypothetical protein